MRMKIVDHWNINEVKDFERTLSAIIDPGVVKVEFVDDNPDVIFATSASTDHLKYKCRKIQMFCNEPHLHQSLGEYDFTVGCAFHSLLSDTDRTCYIPFYVVRMASEPTTKPFAHTDDGYKRRKFCCLVGLMDQRPHRREICDILSKVGQVDHYAPGSIKGGMEAKLEVLRQYRYCVAFEARRKIGYITEKPIDAVLAGCVPIYWGDEETLRHDFILPDGFLYNESNPERTVEAIEAVERDPQAMDDLFQSNRLVFQDPIAHYRRNFSNFLLKVEASI